MYITIGSFKKAEMLKTLDLFTYSSSKTVFITTFCYLRLHLLSRSDFVCKYCGSSLIEDVTCRTLAGNCQIILLL